MTKAMIDLRARNIWAGLNDHDRDLVRGGLFPEAPLEAAERDGFDSASVADALVVIAAGDGPLIRFEFGAVRK